MKDFLVKDIQPNGFFTKPVYLDKAFIITAPEMPFSDEIASVLDKWSFKSVFSEGEASEEYSGSEPGGKAAESSETIGLSQQTDSDKLAKAEEFYSNFVSFVEIMFVRAAV